MHASVVWLALALTADVPPQPLVMPKVLDPRLKIELFAADPDIVTPTGLAIDAKGRLLVVESHTHFRPEGYVGPTTDRIRLFEDTNFDGKADRIETFFEGTTWTMNIGIHPQDGSVYIATRDEIFRLRDVDGDGKNRERKTIVRLETKGAYPHNGLSGFAFDFDGNVYFGLGENTGAEFKLIGTDGSMRSELEGGQVYRCRPDGTKLELLSFGFWNPFHLAFDTFGRLFAVDNDPDSLPPCRLLHIVPGGNYGYRYRNGRRGVHPFTAWNGELPGTLPMVAGTGEAPSGIVAYESDELPKDYIGDLLGTSWGDHRIERFHLERRGASFQALPVPIVRGDENFRPVGIAVAPDGSVFVTDWVLKSYDVHRKGRIWKISAAEPSHAVRPKEPAEAIRSAHRPLREETARTLAADLKTGRPLLQKLAIEDKSPRVRAVAVMALANVQDYETVRKVAVNDLWPDLRPLAIRSLPMGRGVVKFAEPSEPAEVRAEALRRISDSHYADLLWKNVADPDAFIAEAARRGLAEAHAVTWENAPARATPVERLAGLLVLRESKDPEGPKALTKFLRDPDAVVRFAAVQWVGEERLTEYREGLEAALSAGPTTGRLFAGYLAALERLDGVVHQPHDEWAGDQYIVRALEGAKTSPEVRRWSLRMLRPDHPVLSIDLLQKCLAGDDRSLQLEAVRTLRDSRHDQRSALLAQVADNASYPTNLRAEAVAGLSGEDPSSRELLLRLALGNEPSLRSEALRSLRGAKCSESEEKSLLRIGQTTDAPTAELVERVLKPGTTAARPAGDDLSGWLELLAGGDGKFKGDPEAGERVFFHRKSVGCSNCHQMHGRGARIGPELTATTGTLSRERLIESIIRPGKEIAPHFATWLIVTTSGKSMVGMLVHEEATGEQTYSDQKGELTTFKPGEIESRKVQQSSIMPEGLDKQLTVQEFRDLLAYLQLQASAK